MRMFAGVVITGLALLYGYVGLFTPNHQAWGWLPPNWYGWWLARLKTKANQAINLGYGLVLLGLELWLLVHR